MKKVAVIATVVFALFGVSSCSSSSGDDAESKSSALSACDKWDSFVTSSAYIDSILNGAALDASDVEPLLGAAETAAKSAADSASSQEMKDEYEAFSIILGQYIDLATSGSDPGMQGQLADDIAGVCNSYRG